MNIDDEDRVERFEIYTPSGQKKMFPTFLDSLVHFSMPGPNEPGIWTYVAKLYPDSQRAPKSMVDVTATSSNYR